MRPFDYHLVLAYASPILLFSALLLRLMARACPRWRWLVPLVVAAALSVPICGLSPIEHLRGRIGDFSITTLLLLGASAWQYLSGRPVLGCKDHAAIFACTSLAGLVLYPLTLGIGGWDPYELGYRPLAMLGILLVLAAWGRWRGYRAAAFVPIIVLAWCAGLLESTNLWDYLLDPLVAIYGVGWLATALVRR